MIALATEARRSCERSYRRPWYERMYGKLPDEKLPYGKLPDERPIDTSTKPAYADIKQFRRLCDMANVQLPTHADAETLAIINDGSNRTGVLSKEKSIPERDFTNRQVFAV
jgi:hypothetical protein